MTNSPFKSHIEHSKKVFESLSKAEIQKMNEKEQRRVEDSHCRFEEAFNNDSRYLCGAQLNTFSVNNPCYEVLRVASIGIKRHIKSKRQLNPIF